MPNLELKFMYIFPGQGAQYLGMGKDIHNSFACVRSIYERVSNILGYDMAELSFDDPERKLNKTEFAQPALLTHSIACLEVFKELTDGKISPIVTAGHSLGEYSALVAANSISLEDAVKLVQIRGQLMAKYGKGHLVAYRLDAEKLRPIVEKFCCGIGGCNLPDQTVVGGLEKDLRNLDLHAETYLQAKGMTISEEGAFHTYLMTEAAEEFRPYLRDVQISKPNNRVISNNTGSYHSEDCDIIKSNLFFQIFHPVRWVHGMNQALNDGINTIIEFGGGIGVPKKPNLQGITKKILKKSNLHTVYLPAITIPTLKETANVLKSLEGAIEFEEPSEDKPMKAGYSRSLIVPTQNGMVTENSLPYLSQLAELQIKIPIRVMTQFIEQNLSWLQTIYKSSDQSREKEEPEPYLQVAAVGEDTAFLWYVGEELSNALNKLEVDDAKICGFLDLEDTEE